MENAAIIRRELSAAGLTIYGGEHAYVWIKTLRAWTPGASSTICSTKPTWWAHLQRFWRRWRGYFRLSAFNSRANVDEAMARIKAL